MVKIALSRCHCSPIHCISNCTMLGLWVVVLFLLNTGNSDRARAVPQFTFTPLNLSLSDLIDPPPSVSPSAQNGPGVNAPSTFVPLSITTSGSNALASAMASVVAASTPSWLPLAVRYQLVPHGSLFSTHRVTDSPVCSPSPSPSPSANANDVTDTRKRKSATVSVPTSTSSSSLAVSRAPHDDISKETLAVPPKKPKIAAPVVTAASLLPPVRLHVHMYHDSSFIGGLSSPPPSSPRLCAHSFSLFVGCACAEAHYMPPIQFGAFRTTCDLEFCQNDSGAAGVVMLESGQHCIADLRAYP
jgi:hypothetical protein